MNDRAHMPSVLIFFSEKLYGFFKDKICCNNYQQPHSRGLISVTARQYVNSSQKNSTNRTKRHRSERYFFWYDPMKPDTKFDKPGKISLYGYGLGAEIC
uniref:Cobalt/zinc/cadmium efflux RND transporter, membrane fusion protein, CzcB family n=1 Tax=Klebsiella pneumoniae TaxID=573 RepID=A0A8B0SPY6_KLEPN|nr:Cobalt/zinc/cadmium efflux RND transporter, membrane fusion protein, CzcB family [Klebsiella pneumoniae]